MKKFICFTLVLVMGVLFCSCGSTEESVDYGSFTMEKSYSYNEDYYAKVNRFELDGVPTVAVDICKSYNNQIFPTIIRFPEEDFQGFCWENDTCNLWIQVKDKGVICYTYENTVWVIDKDAVLPDYIKTMP
jgi:hypothetical protein